MHNRKPSRTAAYMAFFRALESEQPLSRRLFTDPYALSLLSPSLRFFVLIAGWPVVGPLVHWVLETGWPGTRSSGVVRTRLIDDMVRDAIHHGARQLVLLGAGFDSRGYRLEECGKIAAFEVDHPATQRVKRERLGGLPGMPPAHVRFVAVDFEKDDLARELKNAGFDASVPAVVVWEGVVSYLTEPAVESNLDLLALMLLPGSRLIFTYMHKDVVDGSRTFRGSRRWKYWVGMSSEPFVFGFNPETLAHTLRLRGFELESDASTEEIARCYCAAIGRNEAGSEAYRVASAIRME